LTAFRIRDFQLSGELPGWTLNDRFDIDAKTARPGSDDQTLLMLQRLLAERFQLKFHWESKESTVYFLTVARGGLKMAPGDCSPKRADLPNECGAIRGDGSAKVLDWRGVTVSAPDSVAYRSLAWQLSLELNRPVIDRTGLAGTYDVHLRWARDA